MPRLPNDPNLLDQPEPMRRMQPTRSDPCPHTVCKASRHLQEMGIEVVLVRRCATREQAEQVLAIHTEAALLEGWAVRRVPGSGMTEFVRGDDHFFMFVDSVAAECAAMN